MQKFFLFFLFFSLQVAFAQDCESLTRKVKSVCKSTERLIKKGKYFQAQKSLRKIKDVHEIAEVNRCLLYTSPSPRDRTRSRMPSSA